MNFFCKPGLDSIFYICSRYVLVLNKFSIEYWQNIIRKEEYPWKRKWMETRIKQMVQSLTRCHTENKLQKKKKQGPNNISSSLKNTGILEDIIK